MGAADYGFLGDDVDIKSSIGGREQPVSSPKKSNRAMAPIIFYDIPSDKVGCWSPNTWKIR